MHFKTHLETIKQPAGAADSFIRTTGSKLNGRRARRPILAPFLYEVSRVRISSTQHAH